MPDAAALLHGEGGFLDVFEDGAEVVLDAAHHEAIEQRDLAVGARAGNDAAGRQEAIVGQHIVIACSPTFADLAAALLDGRRCFRDTPPRILDRPIDWFAVRGLQTILLIPDVRRNGAQLERIGMHAVLHAIPMNLVFQSARVNFCSLKVLLLCQQAPEAPRAADSARVQLLQSGGCKPSRCCSPAWA